MTKSKSSMVTMDTLCLTIHLLSEVIVKISFHSYLWVGIYSMKSVPSVVVLVTETSLLPSVENVSNAR